MAEEDKWASPWSNDGARSINLTIVRSGEAAHALEPEERDKVQAPFHPAFVHQIFGESEVIVRPF